MSVCRTIFGIASIALCLNLICTASTASAGMMISVESVTVPAGQPTVVDILVHSDAIGGEFLMVFNAEFRITPELGVASVMEIASVPDISGESNYVFAGTSSGFSGNVLGPPNDVAVVGDFGFAFLDETPQLLARLLLSPGPGLLAPSEGDKFRIEMAPSSGDSFDFLFGLSNTGFLNDNFDPIFFDSTNGIVEVTGNVVPEADAAGLWIVGSAMIGMLSRPWRGRDIVWA